MVIFKNLKFSQIVIANGLYWRYSFDYFLDSMTRLGVKNIELHGNASHFPIEYISRDALSVMKRKIEAHGLHVINLAMDSSYSYPNIGSHNTMLREKTIEIYRRLLMAADFFGAKTIQLLPGRGAYDHPYEEAFENACRTLAEICDIADEYGLKVILENTSAHNTNVANSTADAIRVMDAVGKNNLVSMLDFCSTGNAGDDFKTAFEILGDRMSYVHMCDGTPMGHLVPGEGNLDVEGNLQVLDDAGYRGWLCYEIYHDKYNRDPEKYIGKGLEYLRERMI